MVKRIEIVYNINGSLTFYFKQWSLTPLNFRFLTKEESHVTKVLHFIPELCSQTFGLYSESQNITTYYIYDGWFTCEIKFTIDSYFSIVFSTQILYICY